MNSTSSRAGLAASQVASTCLLRILGALVIALSLTSCDPAPIPFLLVVNSDTRPIVRHSYRSGYWDEVQLMRNDGGTPLGNWEYLLVRMIQTFPQRMSILVNGRHVILVREQADQAEGGCCYRVEGDVERILYPVSIVPFNIDRDGETWTRLEGDVKHPEMKTWLLEFDWETKD